MLQDRRGIRLDAVIQVGDLGAYPSAERYDGPSEPFPATGRRSGWSSRSVRIWAAGSGRETRRRGVSVGS